MFHLGTLFHNSFQLFHLGTHLHNFLWSTIPQVARKSHTRIVWIVLTTQNIEKGFNSEQIIYHLFRFGLVTLQQCSMAHFSAIFRTPISDRVPPGRPRLFPEKKINCQKSCVITPPTSSAQTLPPRSVYEQPAPNTHRRPVPGPHGTITYFKLPDRLFIEHTGPNWKAKWSVMEQKFPQSKWNNTSKMLTVEINFHVMPRFAQHHTYQLSFYYLFLRGPKTMV